MSTIGDVLKKFTILVLVTEWWADFQIKMLPEMIFSEKLNKNFSKTKH